MNCKGFQKLKAWTAAQLKRAIEENKWFLSELEDHDVGDQFAEEDFLDHHCSECGAKWRVTFCGSICEFRVGCELGKALVKRDKK